MKYITEGLKPELFFRFFEDLTRIPRDSGQEDMICQYLIDFAGKHGFECSKDASKNVLIRVPASKGYETHPTVILQAHMDMVCEKNENTIHDFTKDPIKFEIEGDKLIAKETTLGADDGVGIATMLAAAADPECLHPELELVCTSDEERGMSGVEAFDAGVLKGRKLINLDADDEGVFIAGCAGGPVVRIELPIKRVPAAADSVGVHISVKGLVGGHSGEDIHRGRANSNKLLGRILTAVERELPYSLADISGGLKYNAIPREADAVIHVKPSDEAKVCGIVKNMTTAFKTEYYASEPDMDIEAVSCAAMSDELDEASKDKIINFVTLSECGIIRMNAEIEGVESSVSLGVIRLEQDKAVILSMTRSSLESVYMDTYYKIVRLAVLLGGTTEMMSNCPEWEFNPKSELTELFTDTYRQMFGKEPKILVLHAGLECGVIGKKIPEHVDMIAAGPDIRNLHSVGEYFTISSTQRFWSFFKEVLAKL